MQQLVKKSSPGKGDWSISKLWKEEFQRPSSMAAIWSYDELIAENRPAERGFGGRIYFYNERSQAIPVDGDLMVHGYVTTPDYAAEDKVAPDKKFEFPAEKLSAHFSPSDIGASYSIWVPWDAVGGYREEITLIPTFKSKDGDLVQGTPAKLFLKGKARDPSHIQTPAVHQVSYQTMSNAVPSTTPGNQVAKTRTTTIGLPERGSNLIGMRNQTAASTRLTADTTGKRQSFTLTSGALVKPTLRSNEQSDLGNGTLKNTLLPKIQGAAEGTSTRGNLQQNDALPAMPNRPQTRVPGMRETYELRSLQAPTLPTRTPTAALPSVRDLEKGILSCNLTRGQTA